MKITLKQLLLFVAIIAIPFGTYKFGLNKGHAKGYMEAQDHYQVMLSAYARTPGLWEQLGYMWQKYPQMTICGSAFDDTQEWRWYVEYHATQHPWKDRGVWQLIENDANSRKEPLRYMGSDKNIVP
jgi:hypothetical protein